MPAQSVPAGRQQMLIGPQVEIQGVSLIFFILQLLHLSSASILLGKRKVLILSLVSYTHREERLRERMVEGPGRYIAEKGVEDV